MQRREIKPRSSVDQSKRLRFQASLELMEKRELLTTFAVTNVNDSGAGSLRQAILNSNAATATANDIVFELEASVPGSPTTPGPGFNPINRTYTINLQSALPQITQQVTIDGFTQGDKSTFYQYPGAATPTEIASAPSTKNAKVGNNATPEVVIDGSATGGATGFDLVAPDSNIRGLIIDGFGVGISVESSSYGDSIQGNDIGRYFLPIYDPNTGLAPTSGPTFALYGSGNSLQGVLVATTNTTIGGVGAQDANVILANGQEGVSLLPGAHGNQVVGNQIGVTGTSGTGSIFIVAGNGSDGVRIADSSNYVGGLTPVAGNLISGNDGDGVHIVGMAATRNDVLGNYIGTAPGGSYQLGSGNPGNRGDGVTIDNAGFNQIGGSTTAAANVISYNALDGVRIFDNTGGTTSTNNFVQGNTIGLTVDGTSEQGNQANGVAIYSENNTVNETNTISSNLVGVLLSGTGASGNLIASNIIGTDVKGAAKLGNANQGVYIDNASNNTISGTATVGSTGLQIISGNNVGVEITGTSTANQVFGNFIGTDATGTYDVGNSKQGVFINYAQGNIIGLPTSTGFNLISANHTGVEITGSTSTNNVVQGNKIGTDVTGTLPLGNEIDGVYIHQSASFNTVGGSVAAAGNIIAFNIRDGVRIEDASFENPILSNNIFANSENGINLVPNGGPSTSPNHLQPAPTLTSVATSITSTIIQGTLTAIPNSSYTIQFFASNPPQPNAVGKGGNYLGQVKVLTGPNGVATYSVNLPTLLASGQYVTATATDSSGNTSEFSTPITQIFGTVQFAMSSYTVDEGVGTATITVTRTGGSGGYFTVNDATADGTAVAGTDYVAASGTLTFNPGVDSQTISVQINDNGLPSADKYLTLNLSSPAGPIDLGTTSSTTLNILGNEPGAIEFQMSNFTVDAAAGTATITVTRQTPGTTTSVNFATGGGTAIPNVDYTPTSGTLNFGTGDLSKTFTIPILINPNIQGNVNVFLTLSNPTNGSTIGNPSSAVLTIIPATIQFPVTSYVVDQAAGTALIAVSRSSTVGTSTVNYSTSNGTAQAGIDYTPTSGTLTFLPGQSVATFTVPILINPLIKNNLTVNLNLLGAGGGAILGSTTSATLVIVDDGVDRQGPHVTSVKAIAGAKGAAEVILTFDEALNPTTATNLLNYGFSVRTPGRDGKLGTADDKLIGLIRASYNAATNTVTLPLAAAVKAGLPIQIQLNKATDVASAGVGISDLLGNLLDGNDDGYPGGSFTANVVVQPAPKPVHTTTAKATSHKVKAASPVVKIRSVGNHPTGPVKSHTSTPKHHG